MYYTGRRPNGDHLGTFVLTVSIALIASVRVQTAPRFPLGRLYATPGALEALREAGQAASELLYRHQPGDWSEMGEADKQENEFSVDKYLEIFSAHHLSDGTKLGVITEADRSVTPFLLPSEY